MIPSTQNGVAIAFREVAYSFSAGNELLSGLNLQIHRGETFVLLGRSGSGKTTTLKLINDLVSPTAGEVQVEGRATTQWDPIRLRRGIGYVIQDAGLFPHFTVERNIGLVPTIEEWPADRIRQRVTELLQLAAPSTARQAAIAQHQVVIHGGAKASSLDIVEGISCQHVRKEAEFVLAFLEVSGHRRRNSVPFGRSSAMIGMSSGGGGTDLSAAAPRLLSVLLSVLLPSNAPELTAPLAVAFAAAFAASLAMSRYPLDFFVISLRAAKPTRRGRLRYPRALLFLSYVSEA